MFSKVSGRNVEGHVVVLLLRNVEGWSCSSFVKKC